jgi:hypothetical protein
MTSYFLRQKIEEFFYNFQIQFHLNGRAPKYAEKQLPQNVNLNFILLYKWIKTKSFMRKILRHKK